MTSLIKAPLPGHKKDGTLPVVVVSALTCHRSGTLERLLQELARMERPDNIRTIILIVDNDKEGSAEQLVKSYQTAVEDLRYVIEPRAGIPVARNRALDEAIAIDADALCFIDDDEYPDKKWLVNLVEHWQKTEACLIGGPVRVAPADPKFGLLKKLINRSLRARQDRKSRSALGWQQRIRRPTIVTNNWLCDLSWAKKTGIRFDENLLVSGGSDTDFYRQATKAGCKTSWCAEAVVYEIMGPDRLTFRYQFRRGASQSITHFHHKHKRVTLPLAIATIFGASLRLLLGCFLFVLPVLGFTSVVMSIRSMGWAMGRMQAMFGLRSKLYEKAAVASQPPNAEDQVIRTKISEAA